MSSYRNEFTWVAENRDFKWFDCSVEEKTLRSPLISVSNSCHVMFHLYIHARTHDVDQFQTLNYSIIRLNGSFLDDFNVEVALTGLRGKVLNLSSFGVAVDKNFTLENIVTIRCRITFLSPYCRYTADFTELNESIHQLLVTGEFSDITLYTTDNEFLVHKFILRKRAPKLLEDLGLSDDNCKIERVKVDNISTLVLETLLRYIYSGRLDDLPEESFSEFYEIVEKFELEEFNSDIYLEKSDTITTQIKVIRRVICCKVDANATLSDKIILQKLVDFEFARFCVTVSLKITVQNLQIQITIECLSTLNEDILMSWIMCAGFCDSDFQRKTVQMLQFSSRRKQKKSFTHDLGCSSERIRSGLNFKFKLAICNFNSKDVIASIHEKNTLFDIGMFRHEISKLGEDTFHNEDSGDVILCFNDGKLSAHKAILATWSPVFSSMFHLDMREKNTGEVNIPDTDCDTGLRLLRFMYSAEISKDTYEEDVELYGTADKYQVTPLFSKCSSFLSSHITTENACEMLVLADQYNDSNLFETVYKYLAPNPDDIFGSSKWLALIDTYPKLVSKTLKSIFGYLR